jgi:hypothetical protein
MALIPIPRTSKLLKLEIEGRLLSEKQTMQVLVNQQVVGDISETASDMRMEFDLPLELTTDRKNIEIIFYVKEPMSPKDLGLGDDLRHLGFSLACLCFNER